MNQAVNAIPRVSRALVLLLILWCGLIHAQVPRTLNYQGYLTSPSGAAINNSTLPLTFKLYTTASGGTEIYSETQPVNAVNGIFNALIGSFIPLTLAFDQPYFVGISVAGDPEMTPRQPLAASPYAIRSASSAGTFQWQTVAGTAQQAQPNNGYVLTSASQVTVTLPTAPNVGDTVRISGVGQGGWKLAQNAGQFVNAVSLGTSFGQVWSARDSNRGWIAVASSADGSKLIAAAFTGQLYTSTNFGVTWTPRENSRQWRSVASSADGSKLVAAVDAGQLYTSVDFGLTWTAREINRAWYGVASSADGNKLVAAVSGGQLYTSVDAGGIWTARDFPRQWRAVSSSSDGTKLVAVDNSPGRIYTSTDSGATWIARDSSRDWRAVASSADGSKLVAVAFGGQVYTSIDSGGTWTPRESVRNWTSVASSADGTKVVAAVNGGQLYTSVDPGAAWSARESNRAWLAVAASFDGSMLVAAALGDFIYNSTATTTRGTAGYLTGGQSTAIELQYIGSGQFVPLSYVGAFSYY
jgi:hypothetical protein